MSEYPPAYNDRPNAVGDTDFETQKIVAIVAHLGGVFLSWLVPLATFLMFPEARNPWLGRHNKEALNFQITLFIGYLVSSLLTVVLIGFVMLFALWIYSLVGAIMASMAASRGEDYRYPWSIRLIK